MQRRADSGSAAVIAQLAPERAHRARGAGAHQRWADLRQPRRERKRAHAAALQRTIARVLKQRPRVRDHGAGHVTQENERAQAFAALAIATPQQLTGGARRVAQRCAQGVARAQARQLTVRRH